MKKDKRPYRRSTRLTLAGLCTITAIATGVYYSRNPTPYTMMLWLGLGQALFVAGAVLFLLTMIRDARNRALGVSTSRFAAGEVIYREGDRADWVFVIKTGEVEFSRPGPGGETQVLGRLGPEMPFGEMAVLAGAPYGATAVAISDVEALSLHREGFAEMYDSLPFLRQRIDAEVGRRTDLLEEKFGGQAPPPKV